MIFKNYLTEHSYKPEDDISPKEIDLKKEYKILNKLLFDNKLPTDFPMKWNRRKGSGGRTLSRHPRNEKPYVTGVEMSTFYKTTYGLFRDMLAHEMIHVRSVAMDLPDIGGSHGPLFKMEMERINRMNVGINITPKHEMTDKIMKTSNSKAKERGIFILKYEEGNFAIMVLQKELLSKENIEKMAKVMTRSLKTSGRTKGCELYSMTSSHDLLNAYKLKRKWPKAGGNFVFFELNKPAAKILLDDGKLVDVTRLK